MQITSEMKQRTKTNNSLQPKWGELIRKYRISLGETQDEFGKRFGVGYVAVSLWESDKRRPNPQVTWWVLVHERESGK